LEALQAYSLGFQVHVVKLDEAGAAELFQRAITLDPKFAMAYARWRSATLTWVNWGRLPKISAAPTICAST